jgi:predicted transcriptional regulator
MSNKEVVLDLLSQLPEDVSLEDIAEEIAIEAAIQRGKKAADEGRVISHEEMKKRSAEWAIAGRPTLRD